MSVVEKILELIAPHDCLVCGSEGGLICVWCQPDACPGSPERCYRCLTLSPGSRVCVKCRRHSKLSYVWIVTDYEAAAKELVHKLKFARAKAAAVTIAEYLNAVLPYLEPETIVTYVPTSTSRRRVRGYDQAELIAKELAKRRGLTCMRLLNRVGQKQQVGANRATRLKQLDGAFEPANNNFTLGSEILLVDDVLTTGATIENCTKALKQAGAKRVNAAVFAQSQ